MTTTLSLSERFWWAASHFDAALPGQGSGPALYTYLATEAAKELADPSSPFALALEPFEQEPASRMLPLRLLGHVHRHVLAGNLPGLAQFYLSMCGDRPPMEGAWPLFRDAVESMADELPAALAPPHRHNEPTRAAALAVGFQAASQQAGGFPLRLLEIGASAGLLLPWDYYLHLPWLAAMFQAPVPALGTPVRIAQRLGCDLEPLDPRDPSDALTLRSLVWPDLPVHMQAMDDALTVAAANATMPVPVQVDTADGVDWLPRHVMPVPGYTTVVYHSFIGAACPPERMAAIVDVIKGAARRATSTAPLAYLRLEFPDPPLAYLRLEFPDLSLPDAGQRAHLHLTTWPFPGIDRVLATVGDASGRFVRVAVS